MGASKDLKFWLTVQLNVSYFAILLCMFLMIAYNNLKNPLPQVIGTLGIVLAAIFAFHTARRRQAYGGVKTPAERKLLAVLELAYTALIVGGLFIAALMRQRSALWSLFAIVAVPLLIRLVWNKCRDKARPRPDQASESPGR